MSNLPAIDEVELYITSDGFGRAAIIRRGDGLFCLYVHWIWAQESQVGVIAPGGRATWFNDSTPLSELYKDIVPEPGVYGELEDARKAMRSLRGLKDAGLVVV
jgi:hypothetical protein